MKSCLVVDDSRVIRMVARKIMEELEFDVVEAEDGQVAIDCCNQVMPDAVLLDWHMPVMDGIESTRQIREDGGGIRVAVLTMHDDIDKTRDAIAAGASAYLSKGTSFTEVRETVHRVAEGDTVLSPALAGAMLNSARKAEAGQDLLSDRQVEILQSIADGMSTKQTGRHLGITIKTVHNHLNAIYRKLDAQSLTHAVLSAVRLGIIDLNNVDDED